jgi:hypothetical protein
MSILLRCTIFFVFFTYTLIPFAAGAEDLEVGKIYRLGMTVRNLNSIDEADNESYTARKNSKFQVLSVTADQAYIIQFNKIYEFDEKKHPNLKNVEYDRSYKLPNQIGAVKLSEISRESLTGLSAGPLIVPFKFRLNDESLAGDAEIGVYAGITFEPGCTKSNWCFRITPLISAGLSQVAVADEDESENKTAATISVGFLITNWADLNIGFIYGQDRIGDSSWEHEGDGWISFMVGWQL